MARFTRSPLTSAEVDHLESVYGPLADTVRDLVDATIRTTVDHDEVTAVGAELQVLVARLRASQSDEPAGVHYNAEGRSWGWGNAVVGLRNAVAPPLDITHEPDGSAHADVTLGAAYEGPPGLVHGGVSALLLDHIMGETASAFRRVTFTGTLTTRFLRGTPLGPIRLEARTTDEDECKVFVEGTVSDAEGVTVECEGVFIVPTWAVRTS